VHELLYDAVTVSGCTESKAAWLVNECWGRKSP